MKLRLFSAFVLLAAFATSCLADEPWKLRYQGSEEVLGPQKGAKSVDLLGTLAFPDTGDTTGIALANVGFFTSRQLEFLVSLLVGFSAGDSLFSYGLGARYHFIGEQAARTVPYVFAQYFSLEISSVTRTSAIVYGAGIEMFLSPMQAFVLELSRIDPDTGDGSTQLFFGFRAFFAK